MCGDVISEVIQQPPRQVPRICPAVLENTTFVPHLSIQTQKKPSERTNHFRLPLEIIIRRCRPPGSVMAPAIYTSAYLDQLRERMLVIKQNSKQLKSNFEGSIGKASESVKLKLGIANNSTSQHAVDQVDGNLKGVLANKTIHSSDCTSSSKPVVLQKGDELKLQAHHSEGNSGEGQDSTTVKKDGEVRSDSFGYVTLGPSYQGYHSLNSGRMRKSKLEELNRKYTGSSMVSQGILCIALSTKLNRIEQQTPRIKHTKSNLSSNLNINFMAGA